MISISSSARWCALTLAVLLSACGGGGDDAPTAPMPMPAPQQGMMAASLCTESAAAAGEYQQTTEGCVRASSAVRAPAAVGALQARARGLTPAEILDWAEVHYPQYFPREGKADGHSSPYTFRYYPKTDNYLGVSTDSAEQAIYLYGAEAGWQIRYIASVESYTCVIRPQSCLLSAAPSSLSLQAPQGGFQQASAVLTLPANAGSWSVAVDAGKPASWLAAAKQDEFTVRVTATSGDLATGTRSTNLVISYQGQSGGAAYTLKIPVNFTVVQGLVGPPAQTITLDAGAGAAALKGSVAIVRADTTGAQWSASSSEPWLKLSPAAGTTPGSLEYALDMQAAEALANFADHTAIVTLASAGVTGTSFRVTLRKRVSRLTAAMPYGIPAGKRSRVVLGGVGFSQFSDFPGALSVTGGTVSNVRMVSDTQATFDAEPADAGTMSISLRTISGASVPPVKLHVTAADPYAASSVALAGDDSVFSWVHDPVRRALYAISYFGNALYKYQYADGAWSVSAKAFSTPVKLALSADGARLFVARQTQLVAVDPDTLATMASYTIPFEVNSSQSFAGMAATADGKLWIPGTFYGGSMGYFDLASNTMKAASGVSNSFESATYVVPADGSYALAGPSYTSTPAGRWHLYTTSDGSVTNPMGDLQFWHDARVSADGARLMMQFSGEVYDRGYQLLGMLPNAASGESWSRAALTPDGTTIAVLVASSSYNAKMLRIDLFSTTQLSPGTTTFQKKGSIPVDKPSADCGPSGSYGCVWGGALLPTLDGKSIIWAGNKMVQLFKLP